MNRDDAQQALGLLNGEVLDAAKVKAAWARCVKAVHPDTTKQYDLEPAIAVAKLTEARDFLIARINGEKIACKLCQGSGSVRGRLGTQTCTACKGTGDRAP